MPPGQAMPEKFAYTGVSLALLLTVLGLGCRSTAPVPPDWQYGHRYEGRAPDGRVVVEGAPPAEDEGYLYFSATIDSVIVRVAPAPKEAAAGYPVDILMKGLFSDGCGEMDHVEERYAGHILQLTVTARRKRGALCTQAIRPFRFYFELTQPLEPGPYTLKVNGAAHPFRIP